MCLGKAFRRRLDNVHARTRSFINNDGPVAGGVAAGSGLNYVRDGVGEVGRGRSRVREGIGLWWCAWRRGAIDNDNPFCATATPLAVCRPVRAVVVDFEVLVVGNVVAARSSTAIAGCAVV